MAGHWRGWSESREVACGRGNVFARVVSQSAAIGGVRYRGQEWDVGGGFAPQKMVCGWRSPVEAVFVGEANIREAVLKAGLRAA